MKSNNIKCIHCQSNNLISISKKNILSPINEEGFLESKIFNIEELSCSICNGITNVLTIEEELIQVSKEIVLPLCEFNVDILNYESSVCVKFSLKDNKYNINKINKENILKIVDYLEHYNICFNVLDNNVFQLFFNKNSHKFISNKSIFNYINKLFLNAGCNVTSSYDLNCLLLNLYVNEEEFITLLRKNQEIKIDKKLKENNQKNISGMSFLDILKSGQDVSFFDISGKSHSIKSIPNDKVKCSQCYSENIINSKNKDVNRTINENGEKSDEKLYWQEIKCNDCHKISNIIVRNNNVIDYKDCPIVIPLSFLDYEIIIEKEIDIIYIKVSINNELKNNPSYDFLGLDNILGLEEYFQNGDLFISEAQSNCFFIDFESEDLDNYEIIELIKNKMSSAGAIFKKII